MADAHAADLEKKLKFCLVLNTGFAIFEFIAGLLSGSLALVSDAGHNITDSLSLAISFIAQKIAGRKATAEHTYGYGKATILAAFINSLILFSAAVYIFYQAYHRIMNPQPVKGGWVIIIAAAGIAVNAAAALMFYRYRDDLNIKSAFLNTVFDALSSVGAMVAGTIVLLTGRTFADPIIGIFIGVVLVISSYQVMDKATHILLEGVPETISVKDVEQSIKAHPNVKNVHDLHVWTISAKNAALICHIVPRQFSAETNLETVRQIKGELKQKYDINHSTIEFEAAECPPHEH